MKKISKHIINFLSLIFRFRSYLRLRRIERDLKRAILIDKADQIILKDIIIKDIKKALRLDAKSDYIPMDIRNRAEIKEMVIGRHGERMKALNIKITDDLKLVECAW